MTKTELYITSKTDKGIERDHNEDYHGFIPDLETGEWVFLSSREVKSLSEKGSLLIVADGMGGTNAGEVAAQTAVESMRDYFLDKSTEVQAISDEKIRAMLIQGIEYIQNNLTTHQLTHKETEGMGTTLVVSWILKNKAYISWVGDSRIYLYNKNGLIQLSHDHSYVQELVDAGKITSEQAFYHPQSNIITQSLGDAKRPPKPGFITYNLQNDDILLICSDGLNSMITDAEIQNIMQSGHGINELVSVLIDAANKAGGHDNITVMLAQCIQVDSPLPPNPPKPVKANIVNIPSPEREPVDENPDDQNPFTENKSRKPVVYLLGALIIVLLGFIVWQNYPALKTMIGPSKSDTTTKSPTPEGNLNPGDPAKSVKEQTQPLPQEEVKPAEEKPRTETTEKKENLVEENKKKNLGIEENKWKEAKQKGTISAYNEFLKNYRSGVYADSAKTIIKEKTEKFAPIKDSLDSVLKKFAPPNLGTKSSEFKKELEQCIDHASEGVLQFEHLQRLFAAHEKLSGYKATGMNGVRKETINLFKKDPLLTQRQ